MSAKHEKRMATTEKRMVQWGGGAGVSLLDHRLNDEILEEANVELTAMGMRRKRLEWFGHGKGRAETGGIRAVVDMKTDGKRPRGRPTLRWNVAVRRDLKAWNNGEE